MSKLLIDDAGAQRLMLKHTAEVNGELRRYYAAQDARAIVVLRHGLTLEDVRGRVTDAAIGWDERGDPEFVLLRNVGKRHSKATLHRVLSDSVGIRDDVTAELTLTAFLNRAPKG